MIEVVGVAFKPNKKVYYFSPNGMKIKKGINVIVKTERGLQFGTVEIANIEIEESKIKKLNDRLSYRKQNVNCEEMVQEAEKRMYDSKAQYYQSKKQKVISNDEKKGYMQVRTGIREIDTMISVLKEHYNGIYRVSLDTDKAHRILMPSYLGYNEHEENFSKLLAKYIDELVHPDFHRAVSSFLNYDAIRRQMLEGKTPSITYKKVNGEKVVLSVYKLEENNEIPEETLWVFAKD